MSTPTGRRPIGIAPKTRSIKFLNFGKNLNYYLEVDSRRQDRNQSTDAVNRDECETIIVDAQHHLEAATDRLDVLVVLERSQDASIQHVQHE